MTDDAMWVPSTVDLAAVGDRVEAALVAARLANLACSLHAAALEELRVRAAGRRFAREYRHELRAARRMVRR